MAESPGGLPHLILYDGACRLCRGAMDFVRHRGRNFDCAPLAGDEAQTFLLRLGVDANGADSFLVLVDPESERQAILRKSEAALFVFRRLDWPWKALAALHWIPARWRDWAYDWVARNRYRLSGCSESCGPSASVSHGSETP